MKVDKCANCLMHGWKEVEDVTTLQRCKRCKVIKYCGKDCQTDHWKRLHHKHCKLFLDPTNSERWVHKEEDCHFCRESARIGKSLIRRPENPNYECFFKEVEKIPPPFLHPHPFPATFQEGTTFEKVDILLWHLLKKFQLTQPGAIFNCQKEFEEALDTLEMNKLLIWKAKKVTPESVFIYELAPIKFYEIVEKTEAMTDPFQLWKIIQLVTLISVDVLYFELLNSLKNPLADMPTEFHTQVSQALSNSAKYYDTVNQVLEALATQVIPFQDILKIICDDSLEKDCTFCSKKTIISSFNEDGPTILFTSLSSASYCCGRSNCIKEGTLFQKDSLQFKTAVASMMKERMSMQCDFCFKLPPVEEVHRCSRCLTVMYCSKDCQLSDWKIHKITCKKDMEERKKKDGGSGRRKKAIDDTEEFQKRINEINLKVASETVAKFRLKK